MFDHFPNVWTPVLPVAEIETAPLAVELAGETLVLFRNSENQVAALLDRCPHRGAALSLGRVSEQGCLECPYHGWQFDQDGACTHVPLNNPLDIKLAQLSATGLPTQVVAGLVWVFTGTEPSAEPQLPASLKQSADAYHIHHEVWNTHWTRLMENSMDYVHLPFVHRHSFGGMIGQPALAAGSYAEFKITQTDQAVEVLNCFHNIDSGFAFAWHQPNLVVLKFDEMGLPVRVHLFAIPVNHTQTRYLIAIQLLEPQAKAMINEFIDPIIEDRVVIESQQGEIPTVTSECNVPTDQVTLLFRRWYHQTMAANPQKSLLEQQAAMSLIALS
jgi:phenylpropionate dioxygenase-like ring-hydroxylating dioxygenase large terminal subunit